MTGGITEELGKDKFLLSGTGHIGDAYYQNGNEDYLEVKVNTIQITAIGRRSQRVTP